jgi:hypothetical protein
MEIKKTLSSKPLKLLTLLLTSLLIASASAAVYYSLTWQPRVTVQGAPAVGFTSGDDTPAGSTVNSAWATLLLKSYPNATLTYDEGMNISNTDAASHQIRLRHVSISPASSDPAVSNFTTIRFTLIAQNGTTVTTFEYSTTGDTWNTPSTTNYYVIPASEEWTLKVETLSPATATASTEANLEIVLDVLE